MDQANRRGLMLILSSPSGAGKSTIARHLLDSEDLEISVSVTTRARRGSEIDGKHYHFLSVEKFQDMRERDDLLEWAQVHDNFYGTPREMVEKALQAGRDVLFDIDWQGTLQLYEKMRADIVSVFVLPPSAVELRSRLERRAEDSTEVIERRLKNASEEMSHWQEYDYVIVNDDLQTSFETVQSILKGERSRRSRQVHMADFVDGLRSDLS
ncbi:guanylate kinase [Coralliovum pocilloporae]|uniref:guanylate kinase n=1 Tax=Coralliovum pocilloporae TaxID=3066369 RepID=UPI0033077FCF